MKKGLVLVLLVVLVILSFGAELGKNYPRSGRKFAPYYQSRWNTGTWGKGAIYDKAKWKTSFGIYSANATKILLEIYDSPTGKNAKYDYWLQKGSDNVWRARVYGNLKGSYYAFRVWGPNWTYTSSWSRGNSSAGFISDVDYLGNRFNPNKVLYDPYGLEMSHDKETPQMVAAGENGGMFGTGGTNIDSSMTYSGPITGNVAIDRRNVDTGKWASKSVVVVDSTSFGTKPQIAQKDAIIYEAHVRGLTQHSSSTNLKNIMSGIANVDDVPASYRGTYKGAAYMAKYIKAIGFNTIELLPVHETANDINSDTSAGGNFWGYMTYGYFAPDRRYSYDKSPGGPTKEFKEMIAAFHAQGIEVYLDVVFNHTGEGGTWGNSNVAELTSFRGIDNQTYYQLTSDRKNYWETTGCGNNFFTSHPESRELILDSLTYWIDEMGVDGYRFDLAPVLGREGMQGSYSYNYNPNAQTITDISALGEAKNVEMIAEAWDISTYGVGTFPNGWGEWNGRYRDAVRKFIKGGGAGTGFADMFNGDYNNFNDQGGPHKSVNFITAHDGFTLMDLVSYNLKYNTQEYPFGASDGGNSDNDSWDHGGDDKLRRRQLKNLWTIQTFARGIPMGVYGDEFGRTQNGNNNPYNLDSIATWNNYNMIATDTPHLVSTGVAGGYYHNNFGTDTNYDDKNTLVKFVSEVLKIRKNHHALRQDNYSVNYSFSKANGGYLSSSDRAMRIRIDGSSVGDSDFLILINTWTSKVDFNLENCDNGKTWKRIIDTADWAEYTDNIWDVNESGVMPMTYGVHPYSIVVFQQQ